jgi:hypothetical protein
MPRQTDWRRPDGWVLFVDVLIQSFREANPDKVDQELSAAEFLQKNDHHIRGIGPLLEMAGLTEQDVQSALGWRPTQRLINLITNRGGR